ncbi:hypothetical protein [Actinokineospora terrae]|uniref:hypothetical protein n=1 Tax=Actinokineospora terrae TaxID=155974 RepID=UPI000B883185|nr:hypothetical protein [Actinokineospora terrae]
MSTVVALAVAVLAAAPARAEPVGRAEVAPLPRAALDAAVASANTPRAVSFARTNLGQGGQPVPATVSVAGTGVPVYSLNPDFVRGDRSAAAGRFAYVAVLATAPDGREATMTAAPQPDSTWQVTGVLSGSDEHRLLARVPAGGVLLNEPQINGWYALTRDGVTLLQASLPQTPVDRFVPIDDYQHQVAGRYGDKLPGSTYQEDGGLGFQLTTTPAPAVSPAAAPSRRWWWIALSGVAAVVLGAGAVAWRRTRDRPAR